MTFSCHVEGLDRGLISYDVGCRVMKVEESLLGHRCLLWVKVVLLMVGVEVVLPMVGADLEQQVTIEGLYVVLLHFRLRSNSTTMDSLVNQTNFIPIPLLDFPRRLMDYGYHLSPYSHYQEVMVPLRYERLRFNHHLITYFIPTTYCISHSIPALSGWHYTPPIVLSRASV